jgi:hypothetical protein
MPCFCFDILAGADLSDVLDDEDEELEGLNAARVMAVRLSGKS